MLWKSEKGKLRDGGVLNFDILLEKHGEGWLFWQLWDCVLFVAGNDFG